MKKRVWKLCVGCALLFAGCVADNSQPLEVVPAESIAGVLLGASMDDITALLGAPLLSENEPVADSLLQNEWQVGDGILSVLMHNGSVVQIRVEGTDYQTSEGVTRQSSIAAVRQAYPDMAASAMAHDLENMYLDAVDAGIAFSVRGGREGEIMNQNGDVIDVFVHLPGREVIAVVHHHDDHH